VSLRHPSRPQTDRISMAPLDPFMAHAFVLACGFLASAGFMRFVVKKPASDVAKRPKG
jgi:hypothetical protein